MKKTTTRKTGSRILAAVHETASGLHRAGLIDKRRMRDYDALALTAVEPFSPRRIQSLRRELNVSQAVLAALLNSSVSTVQKWEVGAKRPSGPSLKLLNILEKKGIEAVA
ncbi:MAG: DNA-binding transcriptional regulator [Deltaproteobacteria bacterium]|nr:DNA-binding transcriptional regulator [Deltaproteobacteria bacterium]